MNSQGERNLWPIQLLLYRQLQLLRWPFKSLLSQVQGSWPRSSLQLLCQIIVEQLQVRPQAKVTQLVTHLWTAIDAYPGLVDALEEDSRIIQINQINQGNSRGYQTWVAEGGVANIGEHYHVDTDKLKAVLESFLRPPAVGIPQNLPRSGVVQFVGRQTELERLHQHFQQNERLAITAVKGMGGMGKTELALQYYVKLKLKLSIRRIGSITSRSPTLL
jgi:hypothetical protein